MFYSDRNQSALRLLHPSLVVLIQELLRRLEYKGIDILIYDGYRTKEEQDELYKRGRTTPGQIVTYVRGGQSMHNFGLAVDFVPVSSIGTLLWKRGDLYEIVAREAKDLDVDWGFSVWGWDKPHLEYTGGFSYTDLVSGKRPTVRAPEVLAPVVAYPRWSIVTRLKTRLNAILGIRRKTLERRIKRLENRLSSV